MAEEAGVETESYYYLYNAHGDVTGLIDAEGKLAATYDYDAFGTIIAETGTANNSVKYAGYQHDKETDLYYLNVRYYDSTIARFLTEDIYRGQRNYPLSLNLYTYCSNNPVIYFDPSGHSSTPMAIGNEDRKAWGDAIGNVFKGIWGLIIGDSVGKDKKSSTTTNNESSTTTSISSATPVQPPVNPSKNTTNVDSKKNTSINTNTKDDPVPGDPPKQDKSNTSSSASGGNNNKKDDKKDDKNKNKGDSENEHKIGENGTKTTSETVGQNGKTERVDVENPNPGQRDGQIHYHDKNNVKYIYDIVNKVLINPKTGEIAAKSVQKVLNDPWVKKAIEKGLKILRE